MKKKILSFTLLLAVIIVCQNPSANAVEKTVNLKNHKSAPVKANGHKSMAKPFLQYIGSVTDPANSSVSYALYGTSPTVTTINVFINGIPQYNTGATVTGTYRQESPPYASYFIVSVNISGIYSPFHFGGVLHIED
jgi:hypothetical protein